MANNRMYMVHKPSGDEYLLSKNFGVWDSRVKPDFGDWLKDHSIEGYCEENPFVIRYEEGG